MEFIQKLIKNNRPGTPLIPKGVVIHETGNINGADAEAHYKYWNSSPAAKSSAHIVLDDRQIIQLIPYTERAWHAGKTANSRFIGIEICRCVPFDKAKFEKEWEAAVGFTAAIFKDVLGEDEVTADNLLSHSEVSKRWRETDHTDPDWYFAQGGKSMEDFRREVAERIKARASYDQTVNNMINDRVTVAENAVYWERVLAGSETADPVYLRAILDRYHGRVTNGGC